MTTAYISHTIFQQHDPGPHHPESPERLHAINDRLVSTRLFDFLHHFDAIPASREQLLRVHKAAYLDELERRSPSEGRIALDPDTWMSPKTLEAAYHAAGANVLATDLVVGGKVNNAFCAVRPPGHHAMPGKAMGFCLFNNIAVAAAHALEVHGFERIAIVDFDIHHGNGTEAMLGNDPRVLFCSSFQHPYYPYTPLVENHSHIIHMPLKSGTDSERFRAAITDKMLPALDTFQPQMLFISAGFDGHIDDDMSGGKLLDQDYVWITKELMQIADQHAGGRIVSTLEGGYELKSLARSVAGHIQTLMGI